MVVSSVTPASRAASSRPVLEDPRRQLGAVVDDELRFGVRDREQVGVELLARGVVGRMHLDPACDERCADRVLGRAGVRAGGDDLRARLREQQRKVGGLRLEVDDDRDAAAARARRPRASSERAGSGRASGARPTGSAARPRPRVRDRRSGSAARQRSRSANLPWPIGARSCGGGGSGPTWSCGAWRRRRAAAGRPSSPRSRTPRSGRASGRRGSRRPADRGART